MELETLLKKLIELGWKPRGIEWKNIRKHNYIYIYNSDYTMDIKYSINDLCSIDSGLWQFVCENELYGNGFPGLGNICFNYIEGKIETIRFCSEVNYRLMLSSIQEKKTKFILDNIKING